MTCDGHDRHSLGISWQRAVGSGVAGGILIAVDVHWHVRGRGVGVGIGLLLVPVIALLFARWLDGPLLCYRTWGRLRRLDLNSVTEVGVGKQRAGASSVTLAAPGLRKPLSVAVSGRRYLMPALAREHLRRWLTAPHVRWDPDAVVLLEGGVVHRAGRRSRLSTAVLAVGVVTVVASTVWLVVAGRPDAGIAGAPGYRTYGGPHGRLLAVGRPWGRPCQPVRFAVDPRAPDWLYAQIAAVVAEARRDGIDVTIETRNFRWYPASLYYGPGQRPDTTERVFIFMHDETPPRRRDGVPEHVQFGWDARLSDGGRHEELTSVQERLYTQSIGDDPRIARLSARQIIAMTQGIIGVHRSGSGIASSSPVDRFSADDIAAMKRMSGCGNAVGPPVRPQ